MRLLGLLGAVLLVTGCSTGGGIKVDSDEAIEIEQTQLQESNLLDVGILLLEAGEITPERQAEGITVEIRQAESRFIAYHLRETMQGVGGWGSIQVLPAASEIADVLVQGEIVESTGEKLALAIQVSDSTGAVWFENTYHAEVVREDYDEAAENGREIYQAMYNRIANDIYRHRKKLDDATLTKIRNTSELRYASKLAPAIYADYITTNLKGETTIKRLPAIDDPSLLRVRKVREREYLLVNTINEHYGNYYDRVQDPYLNWRRYYLLETLQRREVEREARLKKTLGAAAVVGSILMAVFGEGVSPGLVVGGVLLYQDGANAAEEAVIHREAIVELSESLQADVEPLVVEVDGEALALTGTLDEQYVQWRSLLKEIYEEEIGFPLSPANDEVETL